MTELQLPNFIKVTILNSKVESNKVCKSYNRKYLCRIQNTNTSNSFNLTFHDSVYNWQHNNKLNKADVVYSALMDSQAFACCPRVQDFAQEFGYNIEEYNKVNKIYKACEKTHDHLHKLFSFEQLDELQELFQDY